MIKVADSSTHQIDEVLNTFIYINNEVFEAEFLVYENLSYPAILGMNFLRENNISISFKDGQAIVEKTRNKNKNKT